MFKPLHKALRGRLENLQQGVIRKDSHEALVRDFVQGILGAETLQFIKEIHSSEKEVLIITTNKVFASELVIRKDALLEYARQKGATVASMRII